MLAFSHNKRACGVTRAGNRFFAAQLEQQAGALNVRNALTGTTNDLEDRARLRRLLSSCPCYAAVSKVDEQENVIIRPIVIPAASTSKIKIAVHTQMEEHIHYSDYVLTYGMRERQVVAGNAPGPSTGLDVIAVSVPKNALKEEKDWWLALKLPLPTLSVYALSGPNLFTRLGNTSFRDVLLISANLWGVGGVDFVLLRDCSLVYHRWVAISLDAEEEQRLSSEIEQTHLYIHKTFACDPAICLPPMTMTPLLPGYNTITFNPLEHAQMRYASEDIKTCCLENQARAHLAIGLAMNGLS